MSDKRDTAERMGIRARLTALGTVMTLVLGTFLLSVGVTEPPRQRRWMRRMNQRAISAGHAIVLGLGIVILLVGVYVLIELYYPILPTLSLFVVGVVLVLLGLAETLVEAESDLPRGRFR